MCRIIAEWVAAADALTPRELSDEELMDAVFHEVLDSIVAALQASDSKRSATGDPVALGTTAELVDVAKAHAAHRFTQRFTLKQTADKYRALRMNIARGWSARSTPGAAAWARVANLSSPYP